VEQAQEAAAEAEAERGRGLGLVEEGRVVEPQLLERFAQLAYWSASTGYRPAKTMGFTSLKPGSASVAGCLSSVSVSPILVSEIVLMPATTKPTSPADREALGSGLGVKTPSVSTSYAPPEAMSLTSCRG
jgi:hypothetical protein